MADILALLAVLMFAASVSALFRLNIPEVNKDVILVLIGALTAITKDVYGFYFGSSAAERNKQPIHQDTNTSTITNTTTEQKSQT